MIPGTDCGRSIPDDGAHHLRDPGRSKAKVGSRCHGNWAPVLREFRYPKYGVISANELHIPVSSKTAPAATFLRLTSADVNHSFWIPQLAGKTDLIANHVNTMWLDPEKPGLYVGQCAQFCGSQHAMMLLSRLSVDTPEQFDTWIKNQQQPAHQDPTVEAGREVFERQACMNCHTVSGTAATGRFGPDLT